MTPGPFRIWVFFFSFVLFFIGKGFSTFQSSVYGKWISWVAISWRESHVNNFSSQQKIPLQSKRSHFTHFIVKGKVLFRSINAVWSPVWAISGQALVFFLARSSLMVHRVVSRWTDSIMLDSCCFCCCIFPNLCGHFTSRVWPKDWKCSYGGNISLLCPSGHGLVLKCFSSRQRLSADKQPAPHSLRRNKLAVSSRLSVSLSPAFWNGAIKAHTHTNTENWSKHRSSFARKSKYSDCQRQVSSRNR